VINNDVNISWVTIKSLKKWVPWKIEVVLGSAEVAAASEDLLEIFSKPGSQFSPMHQSELKWERQLIKTSLDKAWNWNVF